VAPQLKTVLYIFFVKNSLFYYHVYHIACFEFTIYHCPHGTPVETSLFFHFRLDSWIPIFEKPVQNVSRKKSCFGQTPQRNASGLCDVVFLILDEIRNVEGQFKAHKLILSQTSDTFHYSRPNSYSYLLS
jgi:hypothetical protein